MEAQRGVVSDPRSHGLRVTGLGLEPRPSGFQSLCSFLIALYGFLLPLQSFIQQWLTEPFLQLLYRIGKRIRQIEGKELQSRGSAQLGLWLLHL